MAISRKDFLKSIPGIIYLSPAVSSLLLGAGCSKNSTAEDRLSGSDPGGDDPSGSGKEVVYINNQADFDKYKNREFTPGSKILFAKGETFIGQFSPSGSGTQDNPIIVSAYDPQTKEIYNEGIEDKPVVNANGKTVSAFYLMNAAFWSISNLEITNDNPAGKDNNVNWRGIDIRAKDAGVIENIIIRNNYIHDVATGLAGKTRGAIFISVSGQQKKTKFHHVRIENNQIENVGGIGISNQSSWGDITDTNYYPWTDVIIRGNNIQYTGRNAIILRSSKDAVIEYNRIGYSSRYDRGNSIFNINTIGCIMQYNEVYGNTGGIDDADRGGFDADFNSENTIIQYNYSHGNHWFCSIMRKYNKGVTIRYNISQNDLLGAYFYGFPGETGAEDVKIYNNTHYFGAGKGTEVFVSAGKVRTPIQTHFLNNILYFTDEGRWSNLPDGSCTVEKNLFYNFKDDSKNGLIADPLFVDPGKGKTDIDRNNGEPLSGYQLQEISPAIDAGMDVTDHGSKDFGGNTLYNDLADIGAYEYKK